MSAYTEFLVMLNSDPDNAFALTALQNLGPEVLDTSEVALAMDDTRKHLRERGASETVVHLYDVEIAYAKGDRLAELLLGKSEVVFDDLLNVKTGIELLAEVVRLSPENDIARERLEHLEQVEIHWQAIVEKYVVEAEATTESSLATSLYRAAAETCARYSSGASEIEEYLSKSLEIDPANHRAGMLLAQLLSKAERWDDLKAHLTASVQVAGSVAERNTLHLRLAKLAQNRLNDTELAVLSMKNVIAAEPGNALALAFLVSHYEAEENWAGAVTLYANALKLKRRTRGSDAELEMLIKIGNLHWRKLKDKESADPYFSRLRKLAPSHQAHLDFYREYYVETNQAGKLMQVYRQALKAAGKEGPERKREIMVELAQLSESSMDNPEKAIDSWKNILRSEPDNTEAIESLRRLYERTGKWNALLDLIKDEVEKLAKDDVKGRVAGLLEVAEIYRDQLKLDVMVINTYNSILVVDPSNVEVLDSLSEKYRSLGRWNDLIAVLGRKAKLEGSSLETRSAILSQIASLWIDRFGNYAQAIKPLEELLSLDPTNSEALERLKEIYTRRRQWRALIALLGREAETMPIPERRLHMAEMARLAGEKLGDAKLSIEIWNRVLELPGSSTDPDDCAPDFPAVLEALTALYEREKRFLALADILSRRRALAVTAQAALPILERLGVLYTDRIGAPKQAAEVYKEILELKPEHGKAARVLRELYASAHDYDALEALYGGMGNWEELVESYFGISDKLEDRADTIALLERAARVANARISNPDKVARVYERLQSVDPTHLGAARALVPLYRDAGKWTRLLSTKEILLGHADEDDRLALIDDIRSLCETHLASKSLAFQWTAKAYKIKSDDVELLAELLRLGAEADEWQEIQVMFSERISQPEVSDDEKLRLLRELGRIADQHLHNASEASAYQRQILALRPDDSEAMAALEELATQQEDWPVLMEILSRRVELSNATEEKVDLLFKLAYIQEENLHDGSGATKHYESVLEMDRDNRRSLRALGRLYEESENWQSLSEKLQSELGLTEDPDDRAALYFRLGDLYQERLQLPEKARACYIECLSLAPSRNVHDALEQYLAESYPAEVRTETATLLLPLFEQAGEYQKVSDVIRILMDSAGPLEQIEFEGKLASLYEGELNDPTRAFESSVKLFLMSPSDSENRMRMDLLGKQLDRLGDLKETLSTGVEACDETGCDESVKLEIALELAVLCDEILDDPIAAERAWLTVLTVDETNSDAYNALQGLYRRTEKWGELKSLIEEHIERAMEPEDRVRSYWQLAELCEGVLENEACATKAFVGIIETDPEQSRAFDALSQVYHRSEQWQLLEELLAKRAVYLDVDALEANENRRARLRAEQLNDVEGAVEIAEELVGRRSDDRVAIQLLEELHEKESVASRISQILEPVYEKEGLWEKLCECLRQQAQTASMPHTAVDLYVRIAGMEEEKLGDVEAAGRTWFAAMKTDGTDFRSLEALLRITPEIGNWETLVSSLESAVQSVDETDIASRARYYRAIGDISRNQLADTDRAIAGYEALVDLEVSDPEVIRYGSDSLDALYGQISDFGKQAVILRRASEWADTSEERKMLLTRVAEIEEVALEDKTAALETWTLVLGEDPEDNAGLLASDRLLEECENYQGLVEIVRRRIELQESEQERAEGLARLSSLYVEKLQEPSEGISCLLEILDLQVDHSKVLVSLSELYKGESRFDDLLDILERRIAIAERPLKTELLFEAGTLLVEPLHRPSEALEHFASILEEEPGHEAAKKELLAFVADPGLRTRAASILDPLYEAAGDYSALVALLESLCKDNSDNRTVMLTLQRIASLQEIPLSDPAAAFDTQIRALRVGLAEPELSDLLSELQRLAVNGGSLDAMVRVYREVAPDVFDGDLQRRIYLDIADLSRAALQDDSTARKYYKLVLESQPDDSRALIALEQLYREGQDYPELYEILVQKADMAGDDLVVRSACLAEAGEICAEQLQRNEDAVLHWEQVLELSPNERGIASKLHVLYRRMERWHDLTESMESRLGFAQTVEEAVDLRFALGGIYETNLQDLDVAVENYGAALNGDPSHEGAMKALNRLLDESTTRSAVAEILEPIHISQQNWPQLVQINEVKLEVADDPEQRLQITKYIASLYEDQLGDLDGAFHWLGRVFRESPSDESVRMQLERLSNNLENYSRLAKVYQGYLDDESGDSPEIASIAETLGDTYNTRLGEIDKALLAYQRALQGNSENLRVFSAAESMLINAKRWSDVAALYEEGIATSMDEERQQQLYANLAVVHEQYLDDIDKAVDAQRAILDINPMRQSAIAELDRLLQVQENWYDLADLLTAQIDNGSDETLVKENRLRLAQLREVRLEDVEGAVDEYEIVLEMPDSGAALTELERLVMDKRHQERIAGILEGVYRKQDSWQKLVVILDTQLVHTADPVRRGEMLREIAQIHETRGGDLNLALEALGKAWLEEISDTELYARFVDLGISLGNSGYLITTLLSGIEDQYDYDLVGLVLLQVASLEETFNDDKSAAVGHLQRLLEITEGHAKALSELDRLLTSMQNWDELIVVLEQQAENSEEETQRLDFLRRVALVQEVERSDRPSAISAYRNVLNVDGSDSSALDALYRLYKADENWTELAQIVLTKADNTIDPVEKRPLHFELASLYEDKLNDTFEAIAQTRMVRDLDPDDSEALASLRSLYKKEAMWQDMLEIIDQQALLASGDEKVALVFDAAQLLEKQLMEVDAAQDRYAAVLELQQTHAGAREALERFSAEIDTMDRSCAILEGVYKKEENWGALASIYERRISSEEDPGSKSLLFQTLATLHEEKRGDFAAAIEVLSRAVSDDPENEQLQQELERVVAGQGAWKELCDVYEKVLDDARDGRVEYHFATRLGTLFEDNIGDMKRAATFFERALAIGENEEHSLVALSRIYERDAQFDKLTDVLSRQSDATMDEAEQAILLFKLGDVREHRLGKVPEAIEAYRMVLEREPANTAGRGALERILGSTKEWRSDIVAILEPLYEEDGDSTRLASLLRTKITVVEDAFERAQIYSRVAEISEQELGDLTAALDAVGGWLAEDPLSEDALAQLLRLGQLQQREGEVAARLDGIVAASESDEVKSRLGLESVKLKLDALGDLDGALGTLEDLLKINPDEEQCLEYLQRICRDKGDVSRLAEVQWHRAEISYDQVAKRDMLAEVATLRLQLQQVEGAVEAWKAVLDLDESDRDAQEALANLYRQQQEHESLVQILSLSTRYISDSEEERRIRVEIAMLYTEVIGDLEQGVEAWQAVLDLDPASMAALDALESLHRRREDFLAVQEVLLRRVDIVETDQEKVLMYLRLAQVAQMDRSEPEEAVDFLRNVLDVDATNEPANDQLGRILGSLERWHDVVELQQRRAETCGIQDDAAGELHWLTQAADVWESKLDNPDEAAEILEKILVRDPNSVAALTRLAKIYEGASDWERCAEILEKALALGPQGTTAADLYVRLGEVARNKDSDEAKAQEYFAQALGFDGYHQVAAKHVEDFARERQDWATVADMLGRRYHVSQDAAEKLDMCVELADLYGAKLGQPEQVIPLLEGARQTAPDDPRILAPLADLYFFSGRYEEAAPMFETLAVEAKKKRKMREVASYKQRLGGILHAQGDIEGAIKGYEDAFRVDPTNVKTMIGLGSLYFSKEDWDKARRVYRSMVLQNLDPDLGVSKADVYFYLGRIHQELGEDMKAKDMYKRALSTDADHANAKSALAML